MHRQERIARLTVAKKKFTALQEQQETIYQDLLKDLGEEDEPSFWIWDFVANDDVSVEKLLEHLKK